MPLQHFHKTTCPRVVSRRFRSPYILHVFPRKTMHYKCMSAYSDAQHSTQAASHVNIVTLHFTKHTVCNAASVWMTKTYVLCLLLVNHCSVSLNVHDTLNCSIKMKLLVDVLRFTSLKNNQIIWLNYYFSLKT